MYIIDNANCYYSEEEIHKYIAFEVLQYIDGAFDMMSNDKWTDANWFINRLKFELFVICILWKEEHVNLTTVLNKSEQRNKLYIPGASCDEKHYMKFLMKKSKRKPKRKNIIWYKSTIKI